MLSIGTSQIKLLEKLCNAMAVSGDEGEVRRIVLDEVNPTPMK
jgi:putative aminopeptidase FrvX